MFKSLIGWDTVGTIVKSRIEMIGAAMVAGIAAVASFGWIPYVTDTVKPTTLAIVAGVVFVNGAVTEFIRRYNAEI